MLTYKQFFYSAKENAVFFSCSTYQGVITQEEVLEGNIKPINFASDVPYPKPEDLEEITEKLYKVYQLSFETKKRAHNLAIITQRNASAEVAKQELQKLGLSEQTINFLITGR